ncbi:outer membrane protein TolC [Flavobacterium cauense R2A-7]|uniref:Outer membrane protein TolC n=1 Tax=Flavobacterium cauense R2A-7 TaxID=1341154 RepID=A0A562M5N9_9FLAO|nr:TolC family protein [Flavobacterium cauense]KGO82224.1 transporter [Flavobacterium cauense R2A-7]TWI15180.1 outer membrane protein TolC [Flavobacterium cauense R2A-7]
MKSNSLRLGIFFLFGFISVQAQEKKTITLEEAIQLSVTQSTEAKLADTKAATKEFEMLTVKNKQYPDVKINGQFQRLTNADVDFKLGNASQGGTSPKVNQLMLGNAMATVPLFAGFKVQNSIKASQSMFEAEKFNAANTKEQLALETVKLYVALYKAQESEKLIQENIKRAEQRVTDFKAMEQNGIIARNDLLKAQLQVSNYQIALEEAKKNRNIVNFQLVTLLKLPEGTQIIPNSALFAQKTELTISSNDISGRNDLLAIQSQQKAAEANVKIAKGNYYPALNLMGGYIAFDLQNVVTVTNAMNFGVGLSYDVTSLFKNGKDVKAAKSKAKEAEQSLEIMTDQAKIQMQQANENYLLAQKQNKVYQEAVTQASENFRIVKDKYDNGLSDTNDLLDADVQQLQSKINEAYSKADIVQKYYEVLAASGKLTSSSTKN